VPNFFAIPLTIIQILVPKIEVARTAQTHTADTPMLLARFCKNRDAGVIPVLALSVVPIMAALAGAVDYGHANSVRTSMQTALDSAALMLSKDVQTLNDQQLTQKAEEYFMALFARPDAQNVQIAPTLTSPQQGSYQLKLEGSATVNTTFARVIGHQQIAISATSEVIWGIKKLNLALVLDNTGSMANNNKMTALKTAAKNLLTTLKNAAKVDGDVKVAIVPFATDVNIGTGYVDADWIDWTDWETKNGTCSKSSFKTKSSCNNNAGIWTPAAHSEWNGCVWDRDQNNDILNTPPVAGSTPTMFAPHQASACPVAMMALSYDWPALNAKIDEMKPTGNTNTTIGLAWGWQALSNVAPLNAPAPAPDLDKVIVMLTDGQNTQNRWTSSSSSIDSRTTTACNNIKAANIKIYTVRVVDGNASLLQGCATNPSMYYDVQQADQLNNVFSSIAQNLANLRIAK
jgi:Mg-chelatase subunit ChlD